MSKAYAAVNLGRAGGQMVLAEVKDKQVEVKDSLGFKNRFVFKDDHDRWDMDALANQVLQGLEQFKAAGYDQLILGIDSSQLGLVMLDRKGRKVQDPISYRDWNNKALGKKLTLKPEISEEEYFRQTGVQFSRLADLYHKCKEDKFQFDKAAKVLTVPDYLNYVLTGKKRNEKTSSMVIRALFDNAELFDNDLPRELHFSREMLCRQAEPGKVLGSLKDKDKLGDYDLPEAEVVATPGIAAICRLSALPLKDETLVVEVGHRSLLGIAGQKNLASQAAGKAGYSSWTSAAGSLLMRFLPGTGLIHDLAWNAAHQQNLNSFIAQTGSIRDFDSLVDWTQADLKQTNAKKFIQDYCRETGQKVPQEPVALMQTLMSSLALTYAAQVKILEKIAGRSFASLEVSNDHPELEAELEPFFQLLSDLTGRRIVLVPAGAAARGNICFMARTRKADLEISEEDCRIFEPQEDLSAEVARFEDFVKKQD